MHLIIFLIVDLFLILIIYFKYRRLEKEQSKSLFINGSTLVYVFGLVAPIIICIINIAIGFMLKIRFEYFWIFFIPLGLPTYLFIQEFYSSYSNNIVYNKYYKEIVNIILKCLLEFNINLTDNDVGISLEYVSKNKMSVNIVIRLREKPDQLEIIEESIRKDINNRYSNLQIDIFFQNKEGYQIK